jgi:short-subunit dehydrogenase
MGFHAPQPAADATCLITGCSSGIGAEIARELAGRGYNVDIVARRGDRLKDLAAELEREHGVRVATHVCDINDDDARETMLAAIAQRGDRIDILVNNAGLGVSGRLNKISRERVTQLVDTNVRSLTALLHPAAAAMAQRGSGAILNVASTAAFQPAPRESLYTGSKAYVKSLSDALHIELAPLGVGVTSLCPGLTRTEFQDTAGLDETWARMPDVLWMSAADVAKQGVDGMLAGKRCVIPGLANKVSAALGQATPRPIMLRVGKLLIPLDKYPDSAGYSGVLSEREEQEQG